MHWVNPEPSTKLKVKISDINEIFTVFNCGPGTIYLCHRKSNLFTNFYWSLFVNQTFIQICTGAYSWICSEPKMKHLPSFFWIYNEPKLVLLPFFFWDKQTIIAFSNIQIAPSSIFLVKYVLWMLKI